MTVGPKRKGRLRGLRAPHQAYVERKVTQKKGKNRKGVIKAPTLKVMPHSISNTLSNLS